MFLIYEFDHYYIIRSLHILEGVTTWWTQIEKSFTFVILLHYWLSSHYFPIADSFILSILCASFDYSQMYFAARHIHVQPVRTSSKLTLSHHWFRQILCACSICPFLKTVKLFQFDLFDLTHLATLPSICLNLYDFN